MVLTSSTPPPELGAAKLVEPTVYRFDCGNDVNRSRRVSLTGFTSIEAVLSHTAEKMATPSSGTREILGPLTTTFTRPTTCSVIGVYPSNRASGWQAAQCFTTTTLAGGEISSEIFGSILYDYTCLPSSTMSDIRQNGFYSPGIICPAGFTRACTAGILADGRPSSVTGPSFAFPYPLEIGETGIGCCPTSYFCQGHDCVSLASTGATLLVTECAGSAFTSTSTFHITVSSPTPTFSVFVPMVQMAYKSSDIEFITIERPTTTVTTTSSPDSGLSAGGKAGIGVGVVAAVLLIALLAVGWLLLRRRKRHSESKEYKQAGGHSDSEERREIGGEHRNELVGRPNASELAGKPNDSELPG